MITVNRNGVLTTFDCLPNGKCIVSSMFETATDKQECCLKIAESCNYSESPALPLWAFNSSSRTQFSRVRALNRVILRQHQEAIHSALVIKPEAKVSDGAAVLTAGVDINDDRFAIEIIGWSTENSEVMGCRESEKKQ